MADMRIPEWLRPTLERVVKADASMGATAMELCDGWKAMDELRALLRAPTFKAEQGNEVGMHTMDAVCDLFMIGKNARTHACVMANIENANRFANLLRAIESEFFMVPCEPDADDEPDDEPQYECLLNCWGSTREQYVEQFREALKKIAAPSLPAAGSAVEEVVVVGHLLLCGNFDDEHGDIDADFDMKVAERLQSELATGAGDVNLPLMTVAQHQRIVAALSAQQDGSVSVPVLSDKERADLLEFHEAVCCDAGHRVDKEGMNRLVEIGAVQSAGFGKHRLTEFGVALLSKRGDV